MNRSNPVTKKLAGSVAGNLPRGLEKDDCSLVILAELMVKSSANARR